MNFQAVYLNNGTVIGAIPVQEQVNSSLENATENSNDVDVDQENLFEETTSKEINGVDERNESNVYAPATLFRKISKYRDKRAFRTWGKKSHYTERQKFAQKRERKNGRFVKANNESPAMLEKKNDLPEEGTLYELEYRHSIRT